MLGRDKWTNTPIEISLGTFALSGISAADLVTDYPIPCNLRVRALRVISVVAPTTANKTATVTVKRKRSGSLAAIPGVTYVLTTAALATKGTVLTGSASNSDRAAAEFRGTDSISLVGSSVTAFVEGSAHFVLVCERIE